MNETQKIRRVIPIMEQISPTFCLAKWHHSTLYLQTGQTHSCYHPSPHIIPLDTIAENPGVLHNTPHKTQERKEMMAGEKTKGCQYCWNIEALGPEHLSDRHERNSSIYNIERLGAILEDPLAPVNPEYIEVSFGNECNFKCGYCHPKHSSAFHKEIKQHGPMTTVVNHRCDIDYLRVFEEDTNPYVDAWWRWWPELSKTLNILRITGGEPLLQQSTWRLFDELDANPKPNLELNLNSNLGVKTILVERLVTRVNKLLKENKIKSFKLFTSIDTWGPRAEYIRTGLDLSLWEKNLDLYLTKTDQPITFMITFNILSVTSFKGLLEKILEWRRKYNKLLQPKWQRIRFDTPYLKEPLQYDMNILPKEYMTYMQDSLDFIKTHTTGWTKGKFSELEYQKFYRVVKYMETTHYDEQRLRQGRKDFYNWFAGLDIRRSTSFETTFPELTNFYAQCRQLTSS
jgi:organic radical activating enzyme